MGKCFRGNEEIEEYEKLQHIETMQECESICLSSRPRCTGFVWDIYHDRCEFIDEEIEASENSLTPHFECYVLRCGANTEEQEQQQTIVQGESAAVQNANVSISCVEDGCHRARRNRKPLNNIVQVNNQCIHIYDFYLLFFGYFFFFFIAEE